MYYVLKYNNNSSLLVDNNNNNNTVTFIFKYDVFYDEKNKYIQYDKTQRNETINHSLLRRNKSFKSMHANNHCCLLECCFWFRYWFRYCFCYYYYCNIT